MANYASLPVRVNPDVFEHALTMLVEKALGSAWAVKKVPWKHDGETWLVYLPNTRTWNEQEAMRRWLAPGEDVAFPVSVDKNGALVFRHGLSSFERWAQGCLEEEASDHYNVGVHYDATDNVMPPGTRRYRKYKAYRDYILTPLKGDPEAMKRMTERYEPQTPKGYW